MSERPRRNRAETEQRLKSALGTVLAEEGFGALTPSRVAAAAGVDKMLIYRYFGDLEGLTEAVARGPDFFPTLEEVCGGDVAAILALPVPERAATVAINFARCLLERPVVLELMVWELVERNQLTAIMETSREETGLRIARDLFGDVADETGQRVNAISAILGAAVAYLALRQRKIRWFNGIDLKSEAGWSQIEATIRAMTAHLAA